LIVSQGFFVLCFPWSKFFCNGSWW
jgi:hypothetical protein